MSIKHHHQSHQSVNTKESLLVWYVSQGECHTDTEFDEECMVHHQRHNSKGRIADSGPSIHMT